MGKSFKISPLNHVADWGYFEDWAAGDAVAPTGWTLSGAGGTIAKESTIKKIGNYSAKVTRNGATCYFRRTFTTAKGIEYWRGKTVTIGCWVYATVASRARVGIDEDVATATYSDYHTGNSTWQFLTATHQIGVAANYARTQLVVANGDTSAYFDGCIVCEGRLTYTDLSSYLEDWNERQPLDLSKFKIPRRPGLYIPNTKLDGKTIDVRGNIADATFSTSRDTWDDIVEALNSHRDELLELWLYDDRFIRAYLDDISKDYEASLRKINFRLKFTAPWPYIRYCGMLRDKQTISSSPTSYNFAYDASAPTWPKITFAPSGNALESCLLENLTTGQSMSFGGTVADGDLLVIDCEAKTVFNDGVDSIADFTGDFLKLLPGTNYFTFTGSNTVIYTDYFKQWII